MTCPRDFTESFDARDWARAFVEHVNQHPEIATDEGTMLAWFANALMRGWDEHANRTNTDIERSPEMRPDTEPETTTTAPTPSPVPVAQFPPHYTAEDLIGLLSRQESVNLERLAATLAHSLQTSALVVDWVNKQILKERAETQAAKDQVEAPAPDPETTTDANTDDGSADYGARTRRRK